MLYNGYVRISDKGTMLLDWLLAPLGLAAKKLTHGQRIIWVAVKGFKLRCHMNSEVYYFVYIYQDCGNLN